MHKILCRAAALAALAIAGSAATASAGDLKLTINNGLVTLVAKDVPVRQILAEWARLGQTTIVNGDKLTGPPLTLQLVDRPEREVLDVVLRSASGYIAAPRTMALANTSQFERVMILPVSHGPVGVAAAPPQPQFGPGRGNMGPQMQLPPPVADEDEPMDPNVPTNQPMVTQPGPPFPNAPPQQGQQPPVMTSPRPGMLPAPPGGQQGQGESPYGAQPPNVRPPGAGDREP
jgi:hypothetical protein